MMYKLLSATVLFVRTTLRERDTPSGSSSFFKNAGVSFQSLTEVTQSFLWPTREGNCARKPELRRVSRTPQSPDHVPARHRSHHGNKWTSPHWDAKDQSPCAR